MAAPKDSKKDTTRPVSERSDADLVWRRLNPDWKNEAPICGEMPEDWRERNFKENSYVRGVLEGNWRERREQRQYEDKLTDRKVEMPEPTTTQYSDDYVEWPIVEPTPIQQTEGDEQGFNPRPIARPIQIIPESQMKTLGFDATYHLEKAPGLRPIPDTSPYSKLGILWRTKCNRGVEKWKPLPEVEHVNMGHAALYKRKRALHEIMKSDRGRYLTVYQLSYTGVDDAQDADGLDKGGEEGDQDGITPQ